mgnify:CR=1 FL=1
MQRAEARLATESGPVARTGHHTDVFGETVARSLRRPTQGKSPWLAIVIAGLVGLVVSCEMEQPALQKVLYDLEAGMPFLFVDQLDVQVPQATATNEGGAGKIRVVLGVTGQWQGPK